jgi:ribosomal biogenesis protein LAS1
MLSSSSTGETSRSGRAEDLVKRWKGVIKLRLKEKIAGEENDSGREIRSLRKLLAEEDPSEVAEALCGLEGLVPVGRKCALHLDNPCIQLIRCRKRTPLSSDVPTSATLHIWTPMIDHLTTMNPSFPVILAQQLLSILAGSAESQGVGSSKVKEVDSKDERQHASFRWTLAVWLIWLWSNGSLPREDKTRIWREMLGYAVHGDQVYVPSHLNSW